MDRHLLRLAGGLAGVGRIIYAHALLIVKNSTRKRPRGGRAKYRMSSMLHLFSGSADALASTVWGRGRATAD